MTTYVLVHGAWHAGWSWDKVAPRLEKAGHKVIAPDLPGLGEDRTPLNKISLPLWRDFVADIASAQTDPVILVGHSRGGIVISEVAELRPRNLRTLVYVSGFLLRRGESLFDLAHQDRTSLISPNMVMSEDKTSSTISSAVARDAFYGECSDEDAAMAGSRLQPEPTLPLATPLTVTEGNFGGVPRVYIECLRDKAVTPGLQKQMYTALPCRRVLSIDTDHSPFLSRPDELVAHLLAI
ncbi:MAG TPA: alpha/beta fold hydrolase [Steroidobacteraceae bacterium]|jgi:pimeloyl-ACP methyl ester carboxylesterase|nr:alpha/beta fold hydrolase [Steroidobacteraceae bacterium]